MPKTLMLAATAALTCGPALAAPTTLEAVTTRGIVMQTRFGFDVPVAYTADGRFTAQPPGDKVSGKWRIVDGRTLCTSLDGDPTETCAAYPDGKAAGDTFEVDGAMGPALGVVKIQIK